MAGLVKIREELHNRVLQGRGLEVMLARPHIERLWEDSNEEVREALRVAINAFDKAAVVKWIKNHASISLEGKSIRELYAIAARYRIKNYSRLTRGQLITQIRDAEAQSAVS